MKVEIIPSAENDIKEIYYYIRHKFKAPLTASQFLDGITAKIKTLEEYPERGAPYGRKYRKIFYKHYRIVYEIKNNTVYIVAVE